MNPFKKISLVSVFVFGISTAFAAAEPSALVSLTWPGIENLWQHENIFLSSSPDGTGLRYAKTQGVDVVINLMEPSEMDWDEMADAQDMGLRYESVPVSPDSPNEAAADRVVSILKETGGQKVLMHCDHAGRALAMWAIYLGRVKGYTPEAALKSAKDAGLDHPGLETFAKNYLKKYQVKPR